MTDVLLATCSDLPEGDEDAALLMAALQRQGLVGTWRVWDDPSADWSAPLVVVRSTWDYTRARDRFLAWGRQVAGLRNPVALIEWNSDKTYLRDLASAGVPTVPTAWWAPGEAEPEFARTGEVVVKPSVGAGSRGAGRFAASDRARIDEHVAALHSAGRTVMIQPYLAGVDVVGERALVYFDGSFSHAITKGAMLPAGTVNTLGGDELFVEERITPATATPAELAVGRRALDALAARLDVVPLYARVDLLPSTDGPVLVELELTEPSLFLAHAEGAADRFARALAVHASAPRRDGVAQQ